jgi:pantoate--beta-alanine ligase
MQIFVEISSLRAYLAHQRNNQLSIGLVPTMGALHRGHMSLIRRSREENDVTVCSIFVNPTQFNNPADLEKYPRTPEADLAMLRENGCDAVFCPEVKDMYGSPPQLKLDFGLLDKILEGEFRPGHFSGVGLVVAKLFNIISPDRAYFGQKDFQQFKVIARLVDELKFDISLVCVPIIREPDGLAMSSRNKRLHDTARKSAAVLYQCLSKTTDGLLRGEPFDVLKIKVLEFCEHHGVRLEYLALAKTEDLSPLVAVNDPDEAILLIAGHVGGVRLIDNLMLSPKA